MVSSGRLTIVYLLLFLSTVASAQSQRTVDKSTNSTISGKVIIGGKGISGVVVGLVQVLSSGSSSHAPTRFRGTSDEDGNYRITNVAPGTYQVVAVAPAYVATDGRKSIVVGKNESVENIDITLLRGGVITGKVIDAEGNPVIEERIYLSQAATGQAPFYLNNLQTDDRGIYRAFGVPAGRYKVSAGTDGHSISNRGSKAEHQRTYHPSATDVAEATVIEVSEGSEAVNVDITLGRTLSRYSAFGRIIDADTSKPVPAMRVAVQFFFPNGSTSTIAGESNKDGEFHVKDLAPGKYAVYVDVPPGSEMHVDPVRFEVIDQDVDGLLLKAAIGGTISGVVIIEGTDDPKLRANLARSRIVGSIAGQMASDTVGRWVHSASINPDGSFRLSGLPAGRFMLQFQSSDPLRFIRLEHNGVTYPRGIEIKEREQITGLRFIVSHANGTIRGVVKRAEGLVLPQGARLMIGLRRTEDPLGTYGSTMEVDARGHFLVERLVPGTYEVVVVLLNVLPSQRPRFPRPTQTVVVTGGAVAEVTLTLQMPNPAPGGP